MNAVKEQLQTITDIARQISNNRIQYASPVTQVSDSIAANNVSVSENTAGEYTKPVSKAVPSETVADIASSGAETVYSEEITVEPALREDIPIVEDSVPKTEEIVPKTAETITTAESDEVEESKPEFVDTMTKDEPVVQEPAPANDDPNKKMSPEDIAALFASASLALEPEPSTPAPKTAIEALSKPAPAVTPVSDDPNKKMSPEDIAALFASAGQ